MYEQPTSGPPDAAAAAFVLIFYGIIFVVSLGIQFFICWFLASCFKRIPQQFRQMEPGQVYLLLIPCVNIIWNFFVYPKLSQSYKAYFHSIGRHDVGDCGEQVGLWYAICCLICGPVAFILWIMYLVTVGGLKGQIPEGGGYQQQGYGGGYPPQQPGKF